MNPTYPPAEHRFARGFAYGVLFSALLFWLPLAVVLWVLR